MNHSQWYRALRVSVFPMRLIQGNISELYVTIIDARVRTSFGKVVLSVAVYAEYELVPDEGKELERGPNHLERADADPINVFNTRMLLEMAPVQAAVEEGWRQECARNSVDQRSNGSGRPEISQQ